MRASQGISAVREGRSSDGSLMVGIPHDNPFADGEGPSQDGIWAIGLRNPFRACWDLESHRFWIAEVGGNNQMTAWEDVHLAHPGADFGYPPCSGPCDDPLLDSCDCNSHVAPLYSYPHAGTGAAVICGMVYRGGRYPGMDDALVIADYVRGWIRYLVVDADGKSIVRTGTLLENAGLVVSLATGPDGAIYYADLAGTIWRVVPDVGSAP